MRVDGDAIDLPMDHAEKDDRHLGADSGQPQQSLHRVGHLAAVLIRKDARRLLDKAHLRNEGEREGE